MSQKPTIEEIKKSICDFNVSLSGENVCHLICILESLRMMQERTKHTDNYWKIRADTLQDIVFLIINPEHQGCNHE